MANAVNNPGYIMRTSTQTDLKERTTCAQVNDTKSSSNGRLTVHRRAETLYADNCGPMTAQKVASRLFFLTMATAQYQFTRVESVRNTSVAIEYVTGFVSRLGCSSKDLVT